jgi:phosphosulfolactate phosphohydrolase-like enzyme
VVIVCSGRGGLPAYDDTLCAGTIAEHVRTCLRDASPPEWLGEGARIALAVAAEARQHGIRAALGASDAGRAVGEVGLEEDLDWCAEVDATDVVPRVAGNARDGLLVVRRWAAPQK